jgi:hypothetical protein
MRHVTFGVLAAVALAGGSAQAMDKGDLVYVRARDTKAYPMPNGKGRPVTLEPSSKGYAWEGNQGPWNQIQLSAKKTAWVYGPNLSVSPPKLEITDARRLTAKEKSDLSAANAMRGLGDGARWYARKEATPEQAKRINQKISTAEAISIQYQPKVLATLKRGGK